MPRSTIAVLASSLPLRGFPISSILKFPAPQYSPDTAAVGRSVDGLVMVLLGGLQTLAGPLVGAVTFTWLRDITEVAVRRTAGRPTTIGSSSPANAPKLIGALANKACFIGRPRMLSRSSSQTGSLWSGTAVPYIMKFPEKIDPCRAE